MVRRGSWLDLCFTLPGFKGISQSQTKSSKTLLVSWQSWGAVAGAGSANVSELREGNQWSVFQREVHSSQV